MGGRAEGGGGSLQCYFSHIKLLDSLAPGHLSSSSVLSPTRPAECWFKPRARGEPGATHSQPGPLSCQPWEANCQLRAGCDPRSDWLVNHRPRPGIGQNVRGARRARAELGGRVRAERAASCGPETRRAQHKPSFYLVCLLI